MVGQKMIQKIKNRVFSHKRMFVPLGMLVAGLFLVVAAPAALMANQNSVIGPLDPPPTSTPQASSLAIPQRQSTSADPQKEACTYPIEYWLTVPERWPAQITMGGIHYNRIDLLALLNSPEEHVAVDVMRSAFGAIMNLYSGAASPWLEDALIEMDAWLAQHPPGSPVSEFNRRRGLQLAADFENFNQGLLHPGLCPDYALAQATAPTPTEMPIPEQLVHESLNQPVHIDRQPPQPNVENPVQVEEPTEPPPPTNTAVPPPPSNTPAPPLPDPTSPPPPPTNTPAPPPDPPSNDPGPSVPSNPPPPDDKDEGKGKGKDDDNGKGKGKDDDNGKGKGKDDDNGKGKGKDDDNGKGKGKDDDNGKGKGKDDDNGKGKDDDKGKGKGKDDDKGKGKDDDKGKGKGKGKGG
jgi:hypothetical protein